MTVTVAPPEPDPNTGLRETVAIPALAMVVVHVTPGAAVTLIAPVRLPPAQPPTDPTETVGVTASVIAPEVAYSAVTDSLELIVTIHAPVPEHAPVKVGSDVPEFG